MDVSRHILVLDTSIFATSNSGRREYYISFFGRNIGNRSAMCGLKLGLAYGVHDGIMVPCSCSMANIAMLSFWVVSIRDRPDSFV
jgi:hypothetical protein